MKYTNSNKDILKYDAFLEVCTKTPSKEEFKEVLEKLPQLDGIEMLCNEDDIELFSDYYNNNDDMKTNLAGYLLNIGILNIYPDIFRLIKVNLEDKVVEFLISTDELGHEDIASLVNLYGYFDEAGWKMHIDIDL